MTRLTRHTNTVPRSLNLTNMPVIESNQVPIYGEVTFDVPPERAVASLAGLVGSERWPQMLDLLRALLAKDGKIVVNRLLTEADIRDRLQISLASAKRILDRHGDVQAGRFWRMTETKFQECVRNRKF